MNNKFLKQKLTENLDYQDFKAFSLQMIDSFKPAYGKEAALANVIGSAQKLTQEYLGNGNYIMARANLRLIIELCAENHSDLHEHIIKNALGFLFTIAEKEGERSYKETYTLLQYFQEIFKNSSKGKMSLSLSYTIYFLGHITLKLKKYEKAHNYYKTLIQESENGPSALSKQDLAQAYANFGALIVNRGGEPKQGQHYLEKALLMFQQYFPHEQTTISEITKNINKAAARHIEQQSNKIFSDDVFSLVNEHEFIDPNAYLSISPCLLNMHIQSDGIIFSFNGEAKHIHELREIFKGQQNLLLLTPVRSLIL